MQISIWYRSDECNPPKPGYYYGRWYVAMSDDKTGWFYWNGKFWSDNHDRKVAAAFWTEIDFDMLTLDKRCPMNDTMKDALKDVQDAIDRYNVLIALITK